MFQTGTIRVNPTVDNFEGLLGMTQLSGHHLAMRMAELARTVAMPRAANEVFAGVTSAALELIPDVDTAGILLVSKRGQFETLAGTSEMIYHLDKLQMTYHEGPCVAAALNETIVRTDDFRNEPRFPRYAHAVVDRGILAGLLFKLFTAERTAGALNLFSFRPNVWTTESEIVGAVLAAHAAAAILASRHGEQLETALSTRDRIGQAKGIIMERYGVDDIRAFDMLRHLSQEANMKLADIAQQVIDTRHSR